MAKRVVVSCAARAFAFPKNKGVGGNPVTIFLPSTSTTSNERIKLAQTCSWESVVIENDDTDASNGGCSLPTFHFYMPSGEEVSFCGHAAIGASSFLANKQSVMSAGSDMLHCNTLSSSSNNESLSFVTADDGLRYDAEVRGNTVELIMNTQHYEAECNSQSCSLENLLSEIGLNLSDVPSTNNESEVCWPTYINSSVARMKTLIPIISNERLHAATAPQNATKFQEMCNAIDSTGVYLYSICTKREIKEAANKKDLVFECRQFPRSSGYAEDPATGIAAGSLAASLHKRKIINDTIIVYQGTAMNRPSKIRVHISDYIYKAVEPNDLKISYSGIVNFDSLSYSNLE